MRTPEQIARAVVGEDALAGIGYGRDYEMVLKGVRATLAEIRRNGEVVTRAKPGAPRGFKRGGEE